MKIKEVQIHNYRSIADQTLRLADYTLLIGPNNSGKTNIVDALRTFYEKDLKFGYNRDFPKFTTDDGECWIEVEYELSDEEVPTIKEEYLINSNTFRVRKWLYPQDKERIGIFGYQRKELSDTRFYGWKNVSESKLGNVIYVPPVSRLEEHTKLTGPSALRDLVNDIFKLTIKSSQAYSELGDQFKKFEDAIKAEQTPDERSLSGLEEMINNEIKSWGASFNLEVRSPRIEELIKGFVTHSITDVQLGAAMEAQSFGHGFQRHLIFVLIRISASYVSPKAEPTKKEFSPELELLLFEEPEAFLHPPQQDVLDTSLRRLADQSERQVLAATHSPLFVSYNTNQISDLACIARVDAKTEVNQIGPERLQEIFEDNRAIHEIIEATKQEQADEEEGVELELEAVRHFLWLNPERCALFFAECVLLVEGLSEQVLTNYLIKAGNIKPAQSIFVLETLGKYNIPRFMNLLGEMEIRHAVLYDAHAEKIGAEKERQERLNKLIEASRNDNTIAINCIPENLERFLGIAVPEQRDRWKASRVLLAVKRKDVAHERIKAFAEMVTQLLTKQHS